MKKKLSLIVIVLLSVAATAQDIDQLRSLNAKAKVLYVRPEVLDQVMISLRPFESMHGNGIDSVMMDTYRAISKGYNDFLHYKQAYEIYTRYLHYKSESLALAKNAAVTRTVTSIAAKSQKDNASQLDMQNQLQQLQIDIDQLSGNRSSFKKFSSVAIIILSIIFGAMLVKAGITLSNFRTKIKSSRERMKQLQRISVLGRFSEGYKNKFTLSMDEINASSKILKPTVLKPNDPVAAKAESIAADIGKITMEIRSTIKS